MDNPQRSIFGDEDERSETIKKFSLMLVVRDIAFATCVIRS